MPNDPNLPKPPNAATLEQVPPQPQATVMLGEYELQVMETICSLAVDHALVGVELYGVLADLEHKAKDARTQLAIARRRLASKAAHRANEESGQ